MAKVKYITVPQNIEGLDHLFGGWLVRIPCTQAPNGEFVALIDVGTTAAGPAFVKKLQLEGIKHIDLILLSHIHVDHAGALAEVMRTYPEAKAVCHTKGVRHLVDPSRLWESTQEVMTELSSMYGKPEPVDEERLIPFSPEELTKLPQTALDYAFPTIEVMAVPGHAPHSLFFSLAGYYFIGEAACCTFESQDRIYFRAATPPRFEMPVFLESINKLLDLPQRPAFAGHSDKAYPSAWLLQRSREQLWRWLDLLTPLSEPLPHPNQEAVLDSMLEVLLKGDPDIGPLGAWSEEKWDIFFHKNSILGFWDYIERTKK